MIILMLGTLGSRQLTSLKTAKTAFISSAIRKNVPKASPWRHFRPRFKLLEINLRAGACALRPIMAIIDGVKAAIKISKSLPWIHGKTLKRISTTPCRAG